MMRSARLAGTVLLMAAAAALPGEASAQDDAFRQGLRARSAKNWTESAEQMRKAIQADGMESTRRIRAGGFAILGGTEYPYLPHFFLGEALLELNDCGGAVEAFSRSEQQKVVTGDRLTAIRKAYGTCAAKGVLPPAAYDPLHNRVAQKYADAEHLLDSLTHQLPAGDVPLPAPIAAAAERARKELEGSKTLLAAGVRSRRQADLLDAEAAATRSLHALTQVRSLVEQSLAQRRTDAIRAGADAFSQVETTLAAFDRRASQNGTAVAARVTSQRIALQKEAVVQRERFQLARASGDVAGIVDATRQVLAVKGRLDSLLASIGPATLRDRGVPEALENGVRLFMRGEYQQSLSALDSGAGLTPQPLTLQVHLFRAAALYALYVRSAETDQALLAKALGEIEQCRKLDAAFHPDSRFFSPRFLALFRNPSVASAR